MTRLLPPLLLALSLLAGWELACRLLDVPPWFLPPPSAVAVSLVERAPILAASAAITFGMAIQALLLAALVGGGLALAVSLSRPAEQAVRPLAVALQVTPGGGRGDGCRGCGVHFAAAGPGKIAKAAGLTRRAGRLGRGGSGEQHQARGDEQGGGQDRGAAQGGVSGRGNGASR